MDGLMIQVDKLIVRGCGFLPGSIEQSPNGDLSLPQPFFPLSCRCSLTLYSSFLDHPGPTLVGHPCLYLSARPISHSFWCSASCGDPDNTVQESCPHKWGQDANCGYLMRR